MARAISIRRLKERTDKHESRINELNEKIKEKEKRPAISNCRHNYELKKAIKSPNFENKTVLTDSTWDYVLTFMQNNKKSEEAIFYWEQAKNFYEATQNLSIIAAPLTTYYCFLNATKALLKCKNVNFDYKHGVSGARLEGRSCLQKEIVKIHPSGVLAGLCNYFGENTCEKVEYSLKDLLYNLPYIHRAYSLTYKSDPELFIPILNPRFVWDSNRNVGWFETELEKEYSDKKTLNKLIGYSVDKYYSNLKNNIIRRNKTFKWECNRKKPITKSVKSFEVYYEKIRKNIYYIYSPNELWYLKRNDLNSDRIVDKHTLVITFAAMHKLSELSRYEPQILKKYLEKEQSWLIREFINKSLVQFIDTISSEITGDDFRQTGFRT
jgi:YaaC-like Protein